MPLFLILLLAIGGTAALYAYAKADNKGPTGKVWPGGITSAQTARAVQIALTKETDPLKLRTFAAVLERYDRPGQVALLTKARQLDLIERGILRPLNPGQTGPVRVP